MDKFSVDFVFEFAKDLKRVIELIEEEFNNNYFLKKEELIVRINQNTLEIIQNLLGKYKNTFNLQIQKESNKYNLKLANSSNEIVIIPEDLFKIMDLSEFKDNYDILLVLMKNNKFNWNYFIVRLTQLLSYSNEKTKTININTMEKIRFFMNFVNFFPDFITETPLPNQSRNLTYKSLYSKWGRSKTYYSVYNRFISNDLNFIKNHISINPIPNFPFWNLKMLMCDGETLNNFPYQKEVPLFPIHVIENMDGSLNSMLFLMPEAIIRERPIAYKEFLIDRFSIINNFNVFPYKIFKKKSLALELPPIFESYTEFIDKYNENKKRTLLEYKTFQFSMNFSKKENLDSQTKPIMNTETIKLFNKRYKEKNNFDTLYSSFTPNKSNSYRILFKNRYSFPDFNYLENFLLKINKKKNVLFEKTIEFFKIWTYQTIVYELKDQVVIYGFIPTGFKYTTELPIIYELLDNLETKYSFLINNKTFKQSTLSLYFLPGSNQFLDEKLDWKLQKYNLLLSIKQKEEIVSAQVNEET